MWLAVVLILWDSFIKAVRQLIILYRCIILVFDEIFKLFCRCSCSNFSVSLVTKAQERICCKEIDRCEEVMEEAIGDRTVCITLHPGFESVCLNRHVLEVAALGLKTWAGKSTQHQIPTMHKCPFYYNYEKEAEKYENTCMETHGKSK